MITVTVKPEHLKGNSYIHHDNEEKRMCPLHEALTEAGYNVRRLGKQDFVADEIRHRIPEVWSGENVERYISLANKGSQETYTMTFEEIPVLVDANHEAVL